MLGKRKGQVCVAEWESREERVEAREKIERIVGEERREASFRERYPQNRKTMSGRTMCD
jgi:hypothetical protein